MSTNGPRRAQAGEAEYQDYYFIFPDRTMPDAYERTLREIFPDVRRGSFTWRADMRRWVWTTFNSFQWDLNYANPQVFRAMADELLFLANAGVEILRLDAVPFIWKRMGTSCENQPEAHLLIQAFNALARIAAPALLFKSEAIVHPDDVAELHRPAGMPDLLQSAADGAAVGGAGDARGQAAGAFHALRASSCRPAAPGSTTCARTTTSAGRSTTTMPRRCRHRRLAATGAS